MTRSRGAPHFCAVIGIIWPTSSFTLIQCKAGRINEMPSKLLPRRITLTLISLCDSIVGPVADRT